MRTLVTIVFVATTILLAQDPPKQDAPKQDATKKKGGGGGMPHKNLKILPDQNIGQIMQSYRVALGAANCDFCHVPGDFSKDDNPKKETARHMIAMVNEINAKFPDGQVHVTCYTCHAGKSHPLTAPPPAAPAGQ
jgi:hypothetical protein